MWVVKRTTSLINSFCSNVARQVARIFVARFTVPLVGTFTELIETTKELLKA